MQIQTPDKSSRRNGGRKVIIEELNDSQHENIMN